MVRAGEQVEVDVPEPRSVAIEAEARIVARGRQKRIDLTDLRNAAVEAYEGVEDGLLQLGDLDIGEALPFAEMLLGEIGAQLGTTRETVKARRRPIVVIDAGQPRNAPAARPRSSRSRAARTSSRPRAFRPGPSCRSCCRMA